MKLYEAEREYWGNKAAGVLCVSAQSGRFLVMLRSDEVNEPNTWGVLSGKVDGKESFEQAATREAREETGYTGKVSLTPMYKFKDNDFTFQNFLGIVDQEFEPKLNWESEDSRWLTLQQLEKLPRKHFGLTALLKDQKSYDLLKKYENKTASELQKGWKSYIGEAKQTIIPDRITFEQAESIFKYFHLSWKKLGEDTFTFSARIPNGPAPWEDDFTKRVSLGPTINDCLVAGADGPYVYAGDLKFTPKDDIPIVDVEETWDDCPYKKFAKKAYRGIMSSAEAFQWFLKELRKNGETLYYYSRNAKGWKKVPENDIEKQNSIVYYSLPISLEQNGHNYWVFGNDPSISLPEKYQKAWYSCVPDAKITHEKWSPKDVKLMYVGAMDSRNKDIILTDHMKQFLIKVGVVFNEE